VAERQFEGADLFDAIDQAAAQLKKDLHLPEAHRESVTDLPVTQVFTSSSTAAKHYAQGRYLRSFVEAATQRAARSYGRATDADTTFALGYLQEGRALWRLGRREKARRAFGSAERHSYRLSESWTYWLKATRLYRLEGQPEAALQVCEQWTSLHPYDLRGWALKAAVQKGLLRYEQALSSYRRMLELAPDSKSVKQNVVAALLRTGQLEKALRRAESYAEAYPKEGDGPLFAGIIQWRRGRLAEAEEAFRQAERLGSQNAGLYLSALHQARGRFEAALSKIKEIATERSGGGTRFRGAGPHLWRHHWLRGRIDRSRHVLDSLRSSKPEGANIFYRSDLLLRTCDYYGPSGSDALIDDALSRLRTLQKEASSGIPAQQIATQGALARCKIAAGRWKDAHQHLRRATRIIERPGTPLAYRLSSHLDYLWGRLREVQGRYREAATRYDRYVEDSSPGFLLFQTLRPPRLRLALVYQKAGRTGDTEETYQEALALHPAHPRLNYHYAQFLADRGRREAAQTHLRRALEGWAPADSDFRLRQKAEALADSLGLSVV
jgi:tetratricopeptide (TPR) repeat protein